MSLQIKSISAVYVNIKAGKGAAAKKKKYGLLGGLIVYVRAIKNVYYAKGAT